MEEKEKKVEMKPAEIDTDVLNILGKECALTNVASDEIMKRFELNALCEMLSQLKNLESALEEQLNLLSIAGNDKIADFFGKVRENMEKEEARAKRKASE